MQGEKARAGVAEIVSRVEVVEQDLLGELAATAAKECASRLQAANAQAEETNK